MAQNTKGKKKMSGDPGVPEHTPLMRQWLEIKGRVGDLLMFYRVGDFYELFWEDAERASRLLDIVLTRRGESGGRPVVMSGVPWHALDIHLARLVKLGVGAAVVDQVGDPAKSVGPVERAITKIVTPGTLVDDALLSDRRDAPLLAIHPMGDKVGLFWMNLASGAARVKVCTLSRLVDEAEWINPAEIITPEGFDFQRSGSMQSKSPSWHFDAERGRAALLSALEAPALSSVGFDATGLDGCLAAAGAALERARASLGGKPPRLARLWHARDDLALRIDASTRKSLEIDQTLRGEESPTLVSTLDLCRTAMGGRRLRDWVGAPLTDAPAIEERFEAVSALRGGCALAFDEEIKGFADVERISARAAALASRPRDFSNLRDAFRRLPAVLLALGTSPHQSPLVGTLVAAAQAPHALTDFLERVVFEEPSVHLRDGGVIRAGFSAELDELRALSTNATEAIESMQQRERTATGIPTLRIDSNRAHGFSIEITRAQSVKAPPHYKRKMTLKNAERYTTDELVAFESKVLSAREQSLALERDLFEKAQATLASFARAISTLAVALSSLDALSAFARAADERGYCRPTLLSGPSRANARSLRHAVAEINLGQEFVPNDLDLSSACRALVVTGPNMGGKSTYMRSLALACAMAQAGSFVPAEHFEFTPFSELFARVGASDDIARGQSTFMVEMTEASAILRLAGPRSLCVIDEIGRGTSTFDGMSLAWSILRHLHDVNESLCLFSTHYFEITDLASRLSACANVHMGAIFENGQLRFLRKLRPGAASQSYGIEVAKLAGVPELALGWARGMLGELEAAEQTLLGASSTAEPRLVAERPIDEQRALAGLREADPDAMTPRQALDALYALRGLLDSPHGTTGDVR